MSPISSTVAENNDASAQILLEALLNHLPLGVGFIDTAATFVQVNDYLASLHGISADKHSGEPVTILGQALGSAYATSIKQVLETGEPLQNVELASAKRKNSEGTSRWRSDFYPLVSAGKVAYILVISTRVTDNPETVENLKHQALHDPLTALPNRTMLKDTLIEMLAASAKTGEHLAVMFLDLDRFKFINDTLGHTVGDKLLKHVSERLQNNIRPSDTVGRLGGDEFMVLLTDIKTPADAVTVAQKILRSIRPPFHIDDQLLHVTTSIGISTYPHDGDDADMLLRNADTAMYRAKESGGNSLEVYKPTMNTKAYEQFTLENNLREALDKNELVLYYQPQVDLLTNEIVGVEALIHWVHPQLGLIFPTEFIGLAEETGLINPIGRWVVANACRQAKQWQDAGLKPLKMAINLSDRQLKDPNLTKIITTALTDSKLNPKYLDLELTENIITHNAERAIKSLNNLKTLGISISIDDFGIGYSSLSHLKKFPVDTLKIDRSFVKNAITDPDDAAIITAIISMAHRLRLTVIAEGVETTKQLAFLRSLDCDSMQGYLYSMPVTADRIEQMLRQNKKLTT